MSILIDDQTKVIVQGITGRDGSFHTKMMLDYGTRVVAGVTPGKEGQRVGKVPVFDTMEKAVQVSGATASVIFVPARFAAAAIGEAADSGVTLIACITEGVPALEMVDLYHELKQKGVRLIDKPGRVGVISRSGTLTYEIVYNLTQAEMGQSTCIGIGGDPIVGTGFIDLLEMFEQDDETDAVVIIGEIGGQEEEKAAAYIRSSMQKKVVAFISGRTAPPGKRMGHAGAIISDGKGGAQEKVSALRDAGVIVADRPDQVPDALKGIST
jgi:succinyl-CoA synthetase alpha subunit